MGKKRTKRNKKPKRTIIKENSIKTAFYDSIQIVNFKAFREVDFNKFKRINFFLGTNNTGKTSLLEAIFAHACGLYLIPFLSQVVQKRDDNRFNGPQHYGEAFLNLYHDSNNLPLTAKINAKLKNDSSIFKSEVTFSPSTILAGLKPNLFKDHNIVPGASKTINYSTNSSKQNINFEKIGELSIELNNRRKTTDIFFPPEGETIKDKHFKSAYFSDILSHRSSLRAVQVYGALKRENLLEEFIKQFQLAFPEIKDIDLIPLPDGSQSFIYLRNLNDNLLPLHVFGDGLRRFYNLVGELLLYKDSIHCIEEMDATLHPKAHEELIKLLTKYSLKYNNQLFITSHSIEFADNFLDVLYGDNSYKDDIDEELLQFFTLKKIDNDNIEIMSMTGEEAYYNRKNYGIELRG